MKTYANGMDTRHQILYACKELFYENGFHETSYEDICQASHVSRRTVYYHFKEKEDIRYDVFWDWVTQLRHLAARYCDRDEYTFSLAMYLLWECSLRDAKYRKFQMDYYKDFPVYTPNRGTGRFYRIAFGQMYGHIWSLEKIPHIAFASVYGYILGMYCMMNERPEMYNAKELLHYCMFWGTSIWGISTEAITGLWDDLSGYIDQFPEDLLTEMKFYE
ncbi:MAG: TetR/AcrR family transcriptional regulator [Lachnospiraceae bacterium]|nr:TetR/AcrR family transcriptional regulator [Lachnospiraceae bacterium]